MDFDKILPFKHESSFLTFEEILENNPTEEDRLVLYLRGFIGGSSLQAKINIAWRACIDDAVLVKGAWSHAGPGKNPLLLFRDSLLHHTVNRAVQHDFHANFPVQDLQFASEKWVLRSFHRLQKKQQLKK